MPRISEMKTSNFIKKETVGSGMLLTITGCQQYNVAMQGAPEDLKWCLEFQELEIPLVLNVTHMSQINQILGSDNTDDWVGKQIVLYNDPTVMYAGKVVGGTRIRASKRPQPATAAPAQPVEDEDLRF